MFNRRGWKRLQLLSLQCPFIHSHSSPPSQKPGWKMCFQTFTKLCRLPMLLSGTVTSCWAMLSSSLLMELHDDNCPCSEGWRGQSVWPSRVLRVHRNPNTEANGSHFFSNPVENNSVFSLREFCLVLQSKMQGTAFQHYSYWPRSLSYHAPSQHPVTPRDALMVSTVQIRSHEPVCSSHTWIQAIRDWTRVVKHFLILRMCCLNTFWDHNTLFYSGQLLKFPSLTLTSLLTLTSASLRIWTLIMLPCNRPTETSITVLPITAHTNPD